MISILISLVALLFSAISLTISYRQFNANKEHQGLTLRPYLNMMHSLDALVSEDLPVTLVWTIKLSNTGLGPALIEEFEIYRDGERVTPDGKRQWQAIAEGFKDKYGIQCHYKFFDLAKNYCVEKSAVIDLLTVSVDDLGDTKNRLAEAVCNCRIVIRYKSFNGQQHVSIATTIRPRRKSCLVRTYVQAGVGGRKVHFITTTSIESARGS